MQTNTFMIVENIENALLVRIVVCYGFWSDDCFSTSEIVH